MDLPYQSSTAAEEDSSSKTSAATEKPETTVQSEDDTLNSDTRLTKCLVLVAATLGFVTSNSFQSCITVWIASYVQDFPSYSYAQLSLIAGLNIAVADIFCAPCGALIEVWGVRKLVLVGGICMVLSFILLAESTKLWQIFLCQSVIQGVGVAAVVLPAIYTAPQHFPRYTGFVCTSVSAGTNLGALLYTLAYNQLDGRVSSAWRNRIIGLSLIPPLAFIVCFLRPPKGQTAVKRKTKIRFTELFPKLSCLRDPALRYLAVSKSLALFSSWGYVVWAQTLFDEVVDSDVRDYLWIISQCCCIIPRIPVGWYCDRWGLLDTTALCVILCAIIGWTTWLPIDNTSTAVAFVVLFGLSSGTIASLADAAILNVAKPSERASALGLAILICTPSALLGPALGGLLVQEGAHRPFLRPGILWGAVLVASACFSVLGRFKHEKDWRKRV